MPSPGNTTDSPLGHSYDLHADGAQASGVADTGANNGTDVPDPSNEQATNGPVSDAITEGKQNAKAVVAASGASAPGSGYDGSSDQPSPASHLNGANGASRKRSHDGSIVASQGNRTSARDTPLNKILLEQYVNREFQHSALSAWHNPSQEIMQQKRAELDYYRTLRHELNPAALYGNGYEGFGTMRTELVRNQPPHLLYPNSRRRPGGRKTRELRIPRRDMKSQSEQIEDLVPIRLDIDWEKIKIRDTFTWNLHDRVVSPDLFAEKLVEDMGLPLESCIPLMRMVSQNIQEQIMDYYPQIFMDHEALDPHLPYNAYKDDEMRILVKLNITIGQHTLVDQFEWDINNPHNSPEEFAAHMTTDLSLSGEFTTAIAHSIREQSQLFTKSLYILSHPFDGRPIDDPDLKANFLPSPLANSFRPFQAAKEYTPYLYELNEADLERTEVSISREQRRQKRSINRRGGPALPDLKDRQRTIRTMIVSSVIPNAAASVEESNLFKRSGSGRHRRSVRQNDGVDDSEESDSDASSTGSPAIGPNLAQGTARTRGMRGAATAAQQAMRANLKASATPEPFYEPRVSARRQEYREESVEEPETLIVKLKIPRQKFIHYLRHGLASMQRPPFQPQQLPPQMQTPTPNPNPTAPPSQLQQQQQQRPTASPASQTPMPAQQIGALDAPHPPQPGVSGVSNYTQPFR